MAAVSSGARVRVFIEFFVDSGGRKRPWRQSTETDNLSIRGCHVSAQLLQFVSKADWDRFQDDAYWFWVMVSTRGTTHIMRYNVGANTPRGESISRANIKWFVKLPQSDSSLAAYSNDKNGNTVAGSLAVLSSYVKDGCDIRGFSSQSYAFPMQNIAVESDSSFVAGQTVDHISQTQNSRFQSNPYWWFTMVTTQGQRDMSRWTVGIHQSRGHTNDRVATEWFADPCWKLVYMHDTSGRSIVGSRDTLVKAILSGQRVRFQFPDSKFYTAEADNLSIRNGHVTAQALKHVSKASLSRFQDDAYWYWLMVSTTGTVRAHRYDVGDDRHRGDTTSRYKVKWFIDSRAWQQVLSHDSNGVALAGNTAQLIHAVKNGASVRCVQGSAGKAGYAFMAQNLQISPDQQHVSAQTLNHVSMTDVPGTDEVKIQPNAYWWFTIVSSRGKRDMSRWTVGEHVDRSHSTDKVATKWYVNY